jgi:hypothetical protein
MFNTCPLRVRSARLNPPVDQPVSAASHLPDHHVCPNFLLCALMPLAGLRGLGFG